MTYDPQKFCTFIKSVCLSARSLMASFHLSVENHCSGLSSSGSSEPTQEIFMREMKT